MGKGVRGNSLARAAQNHSPFPMAEPGTGMPVRSLFDGECPEVGAKVRHTMTPSLTGEVVRVVQRQYCWVTIERPVPADWPDKGFVMRDVELRLDLFTRQWTVIE